MSLTIILILILLLFLRFISVLPNKRQNSKHFQKRSASDKVRTLIVLGSGGHTSEMLKLVSNLDKIRYEPRVYVHAVQDTLSFFKAKKIDIKGEFISIYRARKVKQPFFTTPFTTLIALFHAIYIILRIRPDLILTNGPGTALPIILSAYLLRMASLKRPFPRIIYIESFARVKTPSLTAKLLKPFIDRLITQWPIGDDYEYRGILV